MGKVCAVCGKDKELSSFSKKQWKTGMTRKCKACIDKPLPPAAPAAPMADEVVVAAAEEEPIVEDVTGDVEAAKAEAPAASRKGGFVRHAAAAPAPAPAPAEEEAPAPVEAAAVVAPPPPPEPASFRAEDVIDVAADDVDDAAPTFEDAYATEEEEEPAEVLKEISSEEASELLLAAAGSGDKGGIRRIFKRATKGVKERDVTAALQAAVAMGHHSTLRVLHESGADLDAEGDTGFTALQLAAFKGRDKCIKVLADLGGNVNRDCWTDVARLIGTPLHIAAFYGHDLACEALIDKGHVVDCINYRGRTPVYHAAVNGHAKCLTVLVNHRACINGATRSDNKTQTPLYIAAQRGYLDVVHILVSNSCDLVSWPEADEETGFTGVQNECGKFVRTVRNAGGWQAYQERLHRDRPRLGVETRKVESNKLNLPKNFKNMG